MIKIDEYSPDAIAFLPSLVKLANHILAMADDAYLTGHPEWAEIVSEAKAIEKASAQ